MKWRLCIWLMFGIQSLSAATAIYTVSSRNSVTQEGIVPIASFAEYQQDGSSKNRLTGGSLATLVLYGYDGFLVESITLSMHSNKSSGAGWLNMKVADNSVWVINENPFNSNDWFGAWSSEYVDIVHEFNPQISIEPKQLIRISIFATENSLYINSFTINYRPAPIECYTVGFSSASGNRITSIRETSPGSGIVLPKVNSRNGWYGLGWTEQKIVSSTEQPSYRRAGEMFYPKHNTVLYALYSNLPSGTGDNGVAQQTSILTGEYAIGSSRINALMQGAAKGNRITAYQASTTTKNADSLYVLLCNEVPEDCYYSLEVEDDSTVYIYNIATDSYISPPSDGSAQFSTGTLPWQYRELPDHTFVFYRSYKTSYGTGYRVLHGHEGDTPNTFDQLMFSAKTFNPELFTDRGLILFNIEPTEITERIYSSYPVAQSTETYEIQAIHAEGMILRNPEGEQIDIYTPSGIHSGSTNGDYSLPCAGLYIVRSAHSTIKIIAR